MRTLLIAPSFLSIYAATLLSVAWLMTPASATGPQPVTAYASVVATDTMIDAPLVPVHVQLEPLDSPEMEREDELLLH